MVDERWYSISGSELKNPLLQLKRTEMMLRKLLNDLNENLPIESTIVFVNDDFYLYQAPLEMPIIFPTQLKKFVQRLHSTSSKVNKHQYALAEKLLSLHNDKPMFIDLPKYSYDQMELGITCSQCQSFCVQSCRAKITCPYCHFSEFVEPAVLRSIEEFKLLYPEMPITTNRIYDWCKVVKSKKTIRRVLLKNYYLEGHGRSSRFI